MTNRAREVTVCYRHAHRRSGAESVDLAVTPVTSAVRFLLGRHVAVRADCADGVVAELAAGAAAPDRRHPPRHAARAALRPRLRLRDHQRHRADGARHRCRDGARGSGHARRRVVRLVRVRVARQPSAGGRGAGARRHGGGDGRDVLRRHQHPVRLRAGRQRRVGARQRLRRRPLHPSRRLPDRRRRRRPAAQRDPGDARRRDGGARAALHRCCPRRRAATVVVARRRGDRSARRLPRALDALAPQQRVALRRALRPRDHHRHRRVDRRRRRRHVERRARRA